MICKIKIELDSNTGEMFLPFPKELVDAMGWNDGDQLNWEETRLFWINEWWQPVEIPKEKAIRLIGE